MLNKRTKISLATLVVFITIVLVAMLKAANTAQTADENFAWTIINVSYGDRTGDAHLLQMPTGETWLIDTGFADLAEYMLLPYLQERGISHLDKLLISHAHRNHYGGIYVLLNAGITVDELYFDIPHASPCANENWAMGCDLEHVRNARMYAAQNGVALKSLEPGTSLVAEQKSDFNFRILYRFDGNNTPAGMTSINDTSAIMRMDVGEISVLFPGDLGQQIGEYLAVEGENLDADLLSIPHHGVSVSAPNNFFERVSPEFGFVSGLNSLWNSARSKRIKDYFVAHNVPVYVSDQYRAIRVEIYNDKYTISTE